MHFRRKSSARPVAVLVSIDSLPDVLNPRIERDAGDGLVGNTENYTYDADGKRGKLRGRLPRSRHYDMGETQGRLPRSRHYFPKRIAGSLQPLTLTGSLNSITTNYVQQVNYRCPQQLCKSRCNFAYPNRDRSGRIRAYPGRTPLTIERKEG